MSTAPPVKPFVSPRPTHIRVLVIGLTAAMAFLLYLDRFCLSLPERFIKQDLGLTNNDVSVLFGVFFFGYALGQVPAGWLSDRFGPRLMLTLYILLWSLFTGWMGVAMSLAMLLTLRLGSGLAQAGAYPTGASVISKWVEFPRRGLASATVAIGGRIGGFLAPVLTVYLILACVPAGTPATLDDHDLFNESAIDVVLQKPAPAGSADLRKTLRGKLMDLNKGSVPQGTELREALNRLLAEPGAFVAANLENLSLERQARTLAAIPVERRTAEQTLLLNRFVLEAALPDQVRKYYGAGWRPVMIIYGLAGLVVGAAYWFGARNKPRDHPLCNAAEAELIEKSLPAGTPDPHGHVGALPLRALINNASLWYSSAAQFFTNIGWIFLVTWLPRYLEEVHAVPVVERGWMAGFPILAGISAMFFGGWLTDWTARRLGVRLGRMLPIMLTRFLAAAGFFACLVLHGPWPVTLALAFVAMMTDLGNPAVWAFAQDVGGRHSGSVLGWGNMWGNFGPVIAPTLLNWVAESEYGWNGVFVICGLAFAISGLFAFGMDASAPLLSAEEL